VRENLNSAGKVVINVHLYKVCLLMLLKALCFSEGDQRKTMALHTERGCGCTDEHPGQAKTKFGLPKYFHDF